MRCSRSCYYSETSGNTDTATEYVDSIVAFAAPQVELRTQSPLVIATPPASDKILPAEGGKTVIVVALWRAGGAMPRALLQGARESVVLLRQANTDNGALGGMRFR